ncbi:MarR family winged helix-turn-helix transcriptional regulator [Sporomusa acidovorans]|nr:MarR family transcriptional regulator [Sporomusa acidovorans]
MMNTHDLQALKISYSLLKVVYKFFEIDQKTRYYGTDVPLYPSEMHMINKIKQNEGIHVTGLANILKVTKGAVSQIIIKLEKKGLISKEKDINNQSKLVLKLTPKGETAYNSHIKFHKQIDDMVNEIIRNDSEENIKYLKGVLATLETKLERFKQEADK